MGRGKCPTFAPHNTETQHMIFESINPYNGEHLCNHNTLTTNELHQKETQANRAYEGWRKTLVAQRVALLTELAQQLRNQRDHHARWITLEMGKPLAEAQAEIEKCAQLCDYYAAHADSFLTTQVIDFKGSQAYVRKDPMGVILGIMPWNFPYWQVFRFAVPTLMAGNVVVLKHAPNVLQCATEIEQLFLAAGFPTGAFQNLVLHHEQVLDVMQWPLLSGVSFTGSAQAGSTVAAMAGRHLKKSLLELGGSNGFIVAEDADLDHAVQTAVTARMRNAGQSCIAAKRIILVGHTYAPFLEKFTAAVRELRVGNPLELGTDLGPLARLDLAENLERQMQAALRDGAQLVLGGQRNGTLFSPTILTDVNPSMAVCSEETFGPLAVLMRAPSVEAALEIANQSMYGLGLSIFTQDIPKALSLAAEVTDGALFINDLVKSDPQLPFGGTKNSGYGRELAETGLLEFVNLKTVVVGKPGR